MVLCAYKLIRFSVLLQKESESEIKAQEKQEQLRIQEEEQLTIPKMQQKKELIKKEENKQHPEYEKAALKKRFIGAVEKTKNTLHEAHEKRRNVFRRAIEQVNTRKDTIDTILAGEFYQQVGDFIAKGEPGPFQEWLKLDEKRNKILDDKGAQLLPAKAGRLDNACKAD